MTCILCIDDEPSIREDIVEELQSAGYDTIEAGDGAAGLDAIRRYVPDMVLCDITMPTMSGYDLLTEVRTNHPEYASMPFVFLSALADRKDIITGKKLGVDDYLTKPMDFDDLLATVETRLAQVDRISTRHSQEFDELREEILHLMSHELLTPLNHIGGFSEIIKDQLYGPVHEKYADYADEIICASRQLQGTVRNILNLAEAISGRMKPDIKDCDIYLIVDQEINEQKRQTDDKGLVINFDFSNETLTARTDPYLMKSAFSAILSNAIKFSNPDQVIDVRLRNAADKGVDLEIRDRGPGMSMEDVEEAMKPFSQLDRGFARRHQGCGNGLALVRAITAYADINLNIDSVPQKGTCVQLTVG